MKKPTITLLDVGDTRRFEKSRVATDQHIACVADPLPSGFLNVQVTRNRQEITDVVLGPTRVLHVMGHANELGTMVSDHRIPRPGWLMRKLKLNVLIDYCTFYEIFPEVEVVLLDACNTFSDYWIDGFRELIRRGERVTFIGTTESVVWPKASTYTSCFYSALLSERLEPDPTLFRAQVRRAHDRAVRAFRLLRSEDAPFQRVVIRGRA